MKNQHEELLRRHMMQYHRHNQWRLKDGLYISYAYPLPLNKLSWWDDVGFILNGRRIMVWWVHPRMKYADAIEELAWKEVGEPPLHGADLFEPSEKQWKKVGRSRKKVTAYRSRPTPDIQQDYYSKLSTIKKRLDADGVDMVVRPSMSVETLSWCRGVSLCIPVEVCNKAELGSLAALARRLLKGETTLADEFAGYQFGRADWKAEADLRHGQDHADFTPIFGLRDGHDERCLGRCDERQDGFQPDYHANERGGDGGRHERYGQYGFNSRHQWSVFGDEYLHGFARERIWSNRG